jgi:hypothetical protein
VESCTVRNTKTSGTVLGIVHHGLLAGRRFLRKRFFEVISLLPSRVSQQAGYPPFRSPSSTVNFRKTSSGPWQQTVLPRSLVRIHEHIALAMSFLSFHSYTLEGSVWQALCFRGCCGYSHSSPTKVLRYCRTRPQDP